MLYLTISYNVVNFQALIPSKEDVIPFLEKIRRELDSTELTISDVSFRNFLVGLNKTMAMTPGICCMVNGKTNDHEHRKCGFLPWSLSKF